MINWASIMQDVIAITSSGIIILVLAIIYSKFKG